MKSTYELINEFRKEVTDRFDKMESKMECNFVKTDTYKAEVGPLLRDRDKIYWLVISSVIIAVLSIVLKGIEVLAK